MSGVPELGGELMERRRTLESEGESMKEWKLLKTLTSSDVSSNNDVHITTDNYGNQFIKSYTQ